MFGGCVVVNLRVYSKVGLFEGASSCVLHGCGCHRRQIGGLGVVVAIPMYGRIDLRAKGTRTDSHVVRSSLRVNTLVKNETAGVLGSSLGLVDGRSTVGEAQKSR